MAITTPVYNVREDIKLALDVPETVRDNALVDGAVMAAADDIYGLLHRRFYPEDGTKYWDWPSYQYAYPWRIWFDQYDLVEATDVTSGGSEIPLSAIFFEPVNKESWEPYEYMEIDRSTSYGFGVGPTPQHDVAITGTWGFGATTSPAGSLASSILSTDTAATCTDSSLIGVGQILLAGTERILVTEKSMADTSQALLTPLTAAMNNQIVAVTTGSDYAVGEYILLDAEKMLITAIAGNNLMVNRSVDGTTLATHTGSEIYAPRQLTIARGVLGTTAAGQSGSLSKYVFPGLITELSIALAENNVLQKTSGWSRTVGEGDNQRLASGAALADLVSRAVATFGRKSRLLVI